MYRAVFIDLDGTLLRADHSISEETRSTIHKLIQQDILVVLVSARPYHGITPITRWLGIETLPVASLNGAYIGLNDQIIFSSTIDPDVALRVQQEGAAFGATLIYYTGMEWYSEVHNASIVKEQRITNVPVIIEPFPEMLNTWKSLNANLNKVMAIGDQNTIAMLQAKLRSVYPHDMNIYTSKPTYLEIMHADASKTNALKFLLNKYNIPREETLAIGDNFNDLEMIDYAGTGVAMGNAPDAVKAVADYVTDTNEQDGVRKAIEHFVFGAVV